MITRPRHQPARVALVGIHGHGRWHLRGIGRLAERGAVELAGVCDPRPPDGDTALLVGETPWTADVDELLAAEPDVVIVCTPIHTHVDIALQAAEAGAHLLLEKPPAPSLAEFDRLAAGVSAAGVACQVGFQHLGSGAVAGIAALVADGTLGELRGVGAAGTTVRDAGYFERARWAGRRRLDGADVVDGVLTNPFLHEIAAAIRLAGAEAPEAIAGIELELHRANPIESDDTSVARIVTTSGITIVAAATLCAAAEAEPVITMHGTRGTASWRYRTEDVEIDVDGDVQRLTFERDDLLVNLLAHLDDPATALLVPLESTRAVTAVVDAVRRAPDPRPIPARYVQEVTDRSAPRQVVADVEESVWRAATDLTVFSEQPARWLGDAPEPAVALHVGDRVVADYRLAPAIDPTLSPRPFLDPVRTLGGTLVSDSLPDDHRWHLGVGVALQDVTASGRGGVNFWGGRTYVRDRGYEWRDDHGTIRHLAWIEQDDGVAAHDLAWMAPDHRCLLLERRTIAAGPLPDVEGSDVRLPSVEASGTYDRWVLTLRFSLRNVSGTPVQLGSPGSNGREGGGYGGFFWRLPPLDATGTAVHLRTDAAEGEEAVHGSVAPWLAWVVDAGEAAGDGSGSFTLVAVPDDAATAADPWFVRRSGYRGFGSAIAWDRPIELSTGESTSRGVRTLVVDGAGHDVAALAAAIAPSGTMTRAATRGSCGDG